MRILSPLVRWWNHWWFEHDSQASAELFRITFGAFLCLHFLLSAPNWSLFYGRDRAILPWTPGFSIFRFAPDAPFFSWAVLVFGFLAAVCFTIGYRTRLMSVVLYVVYVSMFHENILRRCGQESLGSLLLFLACFTPLSGRSATEKLWGFRLMQLSVCLLYFFAAVTKLGDETWRDGTALYYLSLDDNWFRYPGVNWTHSLAFSRIATWGTLAIELLFPFWIWFRQTRMLALGSVIALHLGAMVLLAPGIFYFNLFMVLVDMMFLPKSLAERWVWRTRSGFGGLSSVPSPSSSLSR